MAAIERLPALHYSIYYIFLSLEIKDCIVELFLGVSDKAKMAKTS